MRNVLSALFVLAMAMLPEGPAHAEANTNAVNTDPRFKRIREIAKEIPTSYSTMLKAANEYAAVRAKEKEVAATEQKKRGVIWDSVGISGGINRTDTQNLPSSDYPGPQPDVNVRSVSASLSIALSTWFSRNGIALTEEVQKNALKAFKMQLAIEAGTAHYNYSRNTEQFFLLSMIANGLERLKTCSARGEIKLSPENVALLEVQLSSIRFKLESVDAQTSISRSALKRLTGNSYPDLLRVYRQVLEEIRLAEESQPCKHDDGDRVKAKWDGIPWDKIEATFPIPDGVEKAITIARTSPALVMADLNTDLARNQWFLGIAGLAPSLSFNFSRGQTTITSPGNPTSFTDADTFTVSLGFHISGGTPFQLRSAHLLEEAARLNYRATELQVRNSLESAYDTLRSTRANIQLVEQTLRTSTIPALNGIGLVTDENIKAMLGLFEAATAQIDLLSTGFSGYVLQKAGILAQTGTLLEALVELDKKAKSQPQILP